MADLGLCERGDATEGEIREGMIDGREGGKKGGREGGRKGQMEGGEDRGSEKHENSDRRVVVGGRENKEKRHVHSSEVTWRERGRECSNATKILYIIGAQ